MCSYYLLFISETSIIQNEWIPDAVTIKYLPEAEELHSLNGEVADISEVNQNTSSQHQC